VRVVITGAGGQLGQDLLDAFAEHEIVALDHKTCDVVDRDAVLGWLTTVEPDAIVHAAAWTAVDACEADPDRAFAVNALGTRHIAEGARLAGAHLCTISTDYVFDGRATVPYREWDPTSPVNTYGHSKLSGENETFSAPGAAVVRTSWLCGAGGPNFVRTMVRLAAEGAREGTEVPVVNDQWGCPTFTPDLARAIRRVVVARLPGLFHITNQGPTTWFQLARDTFEAAGQDPERVRPITTAELVPARPAPRPAYSVLDNFVLRHSGLPLLADHHEPLERLVKELSA
jgi:dTDP-4-dehydrorhamnose reductase